MAVFHWYDTQLWRQRLQSCIPLSSCRSAKIYPFSMEELYFQLLRQAKLEAPGDSYTRLEELYQCYVQDHPSFNIELKALISGGWLDCFCNRWSLVGHLTKCHAKSVENVRVKAIVEFLLWLQEQVPVERSAVYLENWDAALAEMRRRCPEIPDTEWFLQQRILWEDLRHIHTFSYNLDIGAMHRALARLLAQTQTPEEQAQWAELAHQLQADGNIMEEIPYSLRKTVVSLMTDRILCGTIPKPQEENQSVLRQAMQIQGKMTWELPDTNVINVNDSIERIFQAERGFPVDPMRFSHRNIWKTLELNIVLRNSGIVPEDRRDALLARIKDIHALGILEPFFLPPEACLDLLAYPQTQFAALQTLAKLHREQCAVAGNSAGDCVLNWLAYAIPRLKPGEENSISQFLLYLAEYAYQGTKRHRVDAQLLEGILGQLSRCYFTNELLLSAITNQITVSLENRARHVVKGERFNLLNDWTAHLYGVIPAEQRHCSSLLQTLCHSLGHYLNRLLNEPFSQTASFVPSTIFEAPHWPAVYESLDYNKRYQLLNCVMSWYVGRDCDHQERFYARYQFQLGLGWLTALARMPGAEDQIILTWINFLLYVLDEKNQLLNIEYHEFAADCGELNRAIQTLRRDQPGIEILLKKLASMRTAEIVLLIQYSTDEALRDIFMREIEERPQENGTTMELYNWDKVVAYVLNQKIQPLYSICETRLKEHLAWGKRQNYKHPIFDQDHRQLSHLWLLKGDYESLFSKGHPYVQALALLEGPCQDLRKAASLWESLAKKTREPRAYLYWMQTYVRQLEEIPKGQIEHRQKIYQKIAALRQSVEEGPLISWEREEQLHYADILASAWKEQGMDQTLIVKRATQALPLPEEALIDHWEKAPGEHEAVVELPSTSVVSGGQMEEMLLRFLNLPLASKAGLYFHCRLARSPEQSDTALVFLELFRTLYHLSNYGDKLLVNKQLGEDHCTQLLREIFNLNGSEWWKLSANDQQQSGSTGKISKSGLNISAENDFLVKSENYTYLFVEAMKLENMDRADLEEHLKKLIGDNNQNVPLLLLIYGNSLHPQKLWKQIQSYFQFQFPLLAEPLGIHMAPFVEFQDCALYIPELYAPMEELTQRSITTYVSHHGGESLPLVITYADIGKQAHTVVSRDARER